MSCRRWLALSLPCPVALLCFASPLSAQDALDQAIDANSLSMTMYAGSIPIEEDTRRWLRCEHVQPFGKLKTCPRPADKGGTAAARPVSLQYTTNRGLRGDVLTAFLARAAKQNPEGARQLRAQLERYDYNDVYRKLVLPFGLRDNDTGDSMAAYMLLGWMIVNGAGDPSAADVRGARDQMARALSKDARLSDWKRRGTLGEEFKILFVTIHAGWQAARQEKTVPAFADGLARMIRQQSGMDLRTLRLKGGFVSAG